MHEPSFLDKQYVLEYCDTVIPYHMPCAFQVPGELETCCKALRLDRLTALAMVEILRERFFCAV